MMAEAAPGFLRGKRVVVFGAGYIGGAVAGHAAVAGAHVVALTRNEGRAAELAAQGVATVVADLTALEQWRDRVPVDAEYVLDAVSSGGGGVAGYRRSYVEGLRAILAWAGAGHCQGPLIYTSSTSVYPQSGGVEVDETAATPPAGERAAVLLEAERLALSWPQGATVLR
ncbi:MAG TPA: NAD-dependent epimerase/dehydratase family protein, partial [Candidatus Synoicihabitans sp.]|nr:NAD-dependent epimerase/dehydratase family protein [Candidatus Synoicihabitans sp.]